MHQNQILSKEIFSDRLAGAGAMVAPPWHQLGKRVGATLLRPASAKLLWFSALSAGAYESDLVTVRQSTITVFG
jgi:hypothetical protein